MSTDPGRPDFRILLEWLEGRLDPAAAERVATQIAEADPRTQRTADWLRGFLASAATLRLNGPPPILRQHLSQHFARWSRAQAELTRKPRVISAQLLFDSRQDLAVAGVRAGTEEPGPVHLAYTTDAGDLLVDVYPLDSGQVRLTGQVLPTEPGQAPVFEASVTGAGFATATKDGDELGRFSLGDLPRERCQLRASNGLVTIVADLDLRPTRDRR